MSLGGYNECKITNITGVQSILLYSRLSGEAMSLQVGRLGGDGDLGRPVVLKHGLPRDVYTCPDHPLCTCLFGVRTGASCAVTHPVVVGPVLIRAHFSIGVAYGYLPINRTKMPNQWPNSSAAGVAMPSVVHLRSIDIDLIRECEC